MKLKQFEILISEEVAYKYKIKAKNEKDAKTFAMDNHLEELEINKIAESIDRCEIIDCQEVTE